ncbi:MAG: pyridoxal-phosphate dependent enzyme [Pirellulaceae bacterium]
MSIWRHADVFDSVAQPHRLTLGEGDTPLVRSRSIGPAAGMTNLWFKLEMVNPSGSYKDRFAAAAVSHMAADGKRRCIATSSGNTGAALAAYTAAAGIACKIAIVETAPEAKLLQMLAYGADIFRVRGFGLDPEVTKVVFAALEEAASADDAQLQISAFRYSPRGMGGVRSVACELAEQHDGPIDHVFCPAGGGGLALAVAEGYAKLLSAGKVERSARVECVQPEGNNTIAGPLREGAEKAQPVQCTSKVSGLQVASVVDGDEVIPACRASGGTGHLVPDDATWEAQRRLAADEGVFSEPAGAISVAAALRAVAAGEVDRNATVVCLVTGSGFKDMPSVERMLAGRQAPLLEMGDVAAYVGA